MKKGGPSVAMGGHIWRHGRSQRYSAIDGPGGPTVLPRTVRGGGGGGGGGPILGGNNYRVTVPLLWFRLPILCLTSVVSIKFSFTYMYMYIFMCMNFLEYKLKLFLCFLLPNKSYSKVIFVFPTI